MTRGWGHLRGTLEELASAALRESDDEHAVEHLVERATLLTAPHHEEQASLRDALLTIARSLDAGVGGRGHADRVGRLAATVAETLALPDDEQRCVELAARLHALDEPGVAELAPVPSLREVSALINDYRRMVADGQRRGRRAARARGPVGAHIVAAANAYDELTSGVRQPRIGRAEALARLARDPATYRADVLAALAEAVEQRADPGRRRRSDDARDTEARGAA